MTLDAGRCPNNHLRYPVHPRCPECGAHVRDTIDLSDEEAVIVTWTESTSTPPGVRSPNPLAIVEFTVEGQPVRAIGQLTHGDVEMGDIVSPVHVEALRDTEASMVREPASQPWDGYRFEPLE